MISRRTGMTVAIAVGAVAVSAVYFIDFCDLVYRCGCTHLWAGAADHCNIHNAQPPHCPFCNIGNAGAGAVFAGIAIPQILLSIYPRRWPWARRLLGALLAFPVMGGIQALILGVAMGYWVRG